MLVFLIDASAAHGYEELASCVLVPELEDSLPYLSIDLETIGAASREFMRDVKTWTQKGRDRVATQRYRKKVKRNAARIAN